MSNWRNAELGLTKRIKKIESFLTIPGRFNEPKSIDVSLCPNLWGGIVVGIKTGKQVIKEGTVVITNQQGFVILLRKYVGGDKGGNTASTEMKHLNKGAKGLAPLLLLRIGEK